MTAEDLEPFCVTYTLPDELRRACRHLQMTLCGIYQIRIDPRNTYTGFGSNQKIIQEGRTYHFTRTRREWKRNEPPPLFDLLAKIFAARRLTGTSDQETDQALRFADDILAAIRNEPHVHFSRQLDSFSFRRGHPQNYPVKTRIV